MPPDRKGGRRLLQKEGFAHLVAPNERLRGTKLPEKVHQFAITKNVGMHRQSGRGKLLDGLAVHDAIAVERSRRAAMEKPEHGAPGMQNSEQSLCQARHHGSVKIVE